MGEQPPQLPQGNASPLRGISENFSFHASPESFIASRITALRKERPDVIEKQSPVRAKILNRNVAIISSPAQVRHVLGEGSAGDPPTFEATPAYHELMAPFFPGPNLLLTDGPRHAAIRAPWEKLIRPLPKSSSDLVQAIARHHFAAIDTGSSVDLYDCLKELSWKIVLGTLLGLEPHHPEFLQIRHEQERLLRGQFSLFPVNFSSVLWKSPRHLGIKAREALQTILLRHVQNQHFACPIKGSESINQREIADHLLLFTSSLAVKSFASLLTAFFLNLFVSQRAPIASTPQSLATYAENLRASAPNREFLRNLLVETERRSPPIVGVMRRCTRETIIPSHGQEPDTLIPEGWDVWCYFPKVQEEGAGTNLNHQGLDRDPTIGCAASPDSLAFGYGSKKCLGRSITEAWAVDCAETCLNNGMMFSGSVEAPGVRDWLGWGNSSPVSMEGKARDMKQLPTQRPTRPVVVKFNQA